MKVVNGREIPNFPGELTSQEGVNMLVDLLTECANAFSATVDGDTLALTALGVAGTSTFTLGATDTVTIDAGTTDHTAATVVNMDVDVNSANCKAISMDIDVGTALSTGESVSGLYIDIDGLSGDHANSIMNGISLTSANTSGSSTNSAVRIAGTWDYLVYSLANSTTGIGLAGNHTTAISMNGTNTTAIGISGTIAKGIDFTGATPTYAAYSTAGTGSRNTPFVKIGAWDDPLTIVQTSDHWVPIQVNVKKSGNIAFDTAAARLRVDTDGAQATSAVGCLQLRQNLAHNLASSAILNASVNVSAAVAVQSGSLLGGYFSIEGSGAVTKAGDNDCTVLEAVCNNTGGGIDNVFLALQNGSGTHVDEIVKIAVTNGTADCGLRFEGLTDQIFVAGSSSTPLVCDDADIKFVQIYTDCGASSGDNRGIYNRLYLTGTGGGESLRSYTDLSGTVGTAHGCHISLGFGESTTTGAVTGLGIAGRFTLGLANIAYPATGNLGVLEAEVYSFGANADPAGNAIAMIRIGNNGDSGGQADVDDDAVCFAFDGWTSATGNMVVKAGTPGAMGNATYSVRCRMMDGTLAYLNFTANPVTA